MSKTKDNLLTEQQQTNEALDAAWVEESMENSVLTASWNEALVALAVLNKRLDDTFKSLKEAASVMEKVLKDSHIKSLLTMSRKDV